MKYSHDPQPGVSITGTSFVLRPHNLKELSGLYSISTRTFKKWLIPFKKEIGERMGNFYTVTQVKKIFDLLGLPNALYEEGGGGRVGAVISLLSIIPGCW